MCAESLKWYQKIQEKWREIKEQRTGHSENHLDLVLK